MLLNRIRFCSAEKNLIKEIKCARCRVPASERYDKRLVERRSKRKPSKERRSDTNQRQVQYALCPSPIRLFFIGIVYFLFYTGFIFITIPVILISIYAGVKIALRQDLPVPEISISEGSIEQAKDTFRKDIDRSMKKFYNKSPSDGLYTRQVPIMASRIADIYTTKYNAPLLEKTKKQLNQCYYACEAIDKLFIESFKYYFKTINEQLDMYLYAESKDEKEIIGERIFSLGQSMRNARADWENIISRIAGEEKDYKHIVNARNIDKEISKLGKSPVWKAVINDMIEIKPAHKEDVISGYEGIK